MLARGTEDKEHAMSQKLDTSPALIGIDIGKNSFHIIGQNQRGAVVLRQKWSRGQVDARLAKELEEMAARLLALARKLPPGQQRYDIVQQIGRFRVRIAALKGPELGRSRRGPKAKEK
jgi:hypothetical protein